MQARMDAERVDKRRLTSFGDLVAGFYHSGSERQLQDFGFIFVFNQRRDGLEDRMFWHGWV
jgi:hypothetical protein